MSASTPPVAVLSLALANLSVSARFTHHYRKAQPPDFRSGLPVYREDRCDLGLGSTVTPINRYLAAGTITSIAEGFVIFREIAGRTEILPLHEACARFYVCEAGAPEPTSASSREEARK